MADQIAKVGSAASAAAAALEAEAGDAGEAFSGAKDPAEADLDRVIEDEMTKLEEAFEAKAADAAEVHTYLRDNYARYL